MPAPGTSRTLPLILAAMLGMGFDSMPAMAQQPAHATAFHPGGTWPDEDGKHIDAHGGNILLDPKSGRFFWFGEHRGNPRGIGCYSSADLYNWKYEGLAMTAAAAGLTGMVFERPKVVRNPITGKYVMWYHHDSGNYSLAHLGVAVSDSLKGPYVMVRHFRPNGHESRDLGLFADEDGKVYILYSADNNSTIRVVELTADYLNVTARDADTRTHCEGEGMLKRDGLYYLLSSQCSGWAPNRASYATATDIMGPYTVKGDPAIGDAAHTTFNSQPTFILTLPGYRNGYVYMGDRWNGVGSVNSQYVFLPILIPKAGTLELRWRDEWSLAEFTPASLADPAGNGMAPAAGPIGCCLFRGRNGIPEGSGFDAAGRWTERRLLP